MSGRGAPEPTTPDGRGLRVAIVATRWHEQVTDGLVAGAHRALTAACVEDLAVLRVPGAFELAIAAKALAHHVCRAVTDGLTRVALDAGVPIGFGVLTCDSEEQALDRCGLTGSSEDKGREAAMAAVETALLLRKVRRGEGHEEATGR
jgi:6,7-dimethyl-8-ribityllumazine synthase